MASVYRHILARTEDLGLVWDRRFDALRDNDNAAGACTFFASSKQSARKPEPNRNKGSFIWHHTIGERKRYSLVEYDGSGYSQSWSRASNAPLAPDGTIDRQGLDWTGHTLIMYDPTNNKLVLTRIQELFEISLGTFLNVGQDVCWADGRIITQRGVGNPGPFYIHHLDGNTPRSAVLGGGVGFFQDVTGITWDGNSIYTVRQSGNNIIIERVHLAPEASPVLVDSNALSIGPDLDTVFGCDFNGRDLEIWYRLINQDP